MAREAASDAILVRMHASRIHISYPDWVREVVDWEQCLPDDESKMRLAIRIARENVMRDTGGPFGAIIVERGTGRLVSAGMNSVVRLQNPVLHGEVMAFMMASARLGSYTLRVPGSPDHELITSSEPCAMCLGATLWSGVRRLVWGASRSDAERVQFDEGPVFAESYDYLRARGIEVVPALLREEAAAVLELYRERAGTIYNA
ncbi:MAG: nucleoside deaminase [Gemmatimonadota bacterium]|nr:nucleoside deaminase [Gemmatimonadota bacterium]